jgi:N-acetylmuramoyl-L-alanine amidase
MTNFVRAAAQAAIFLGFAGAATFASPLMAMELDVKPGWARTIGHAAAHIEGSASIDSGIGAADSLPGTDFATPPAPAPAAAAADTKPKSLRELVDAHSSTEVSDAELECLAGAVYFESKGEPLEGQLAVAEVIINRANSGRYPSSYCGVVKQKSQFSFVRGGRIPAIPRSSTAWQKAVAIAEIASKDLADSAVSTAMFFHARYVAPGWRGLKRMATVGNHIFYR